MRVLVGVLLLCVCWEGGKKLAIGLKEVSEERSEDIAWKGNRSG